VSIGRGVLRAAVLLVAVVATPGVVPAQQGRAADDDGERRFVESLRRDDPAAAERYVTLRDARREAITELQRVQEQYRGAGAELRAIFLPTLKQAERRYAEASLALLDFLDARDRQALASYQEQIARITGLLEERQRARSELEQLRRGD
jgi:hypothetical protein